MQPTHYNLPLCRDNLRGFFEQCFSLVLKQVFGFDGFSWLNIIAKACTHSPSCGVRFVVYHGFTLLSLDLST